ncbi:hypothetical protein A4G99_21015 [Haladaptatus sp. R4]|uniref:hypothetical protein n=1 Tax=Haladaptatus sp. R4 TaxID=1679489 RepID=UPI0007B4A153|nr:hypothetical protein [Haladaptatus sp. R4]KZN26521.1 hypothetical protein A4G99_21015 [Haladaptatus sp. R4]
MSDHEGDVSANDVPRTKAELTERVTQNGELFARPQRWTYPDGREIHVLPDLHSDGITDIFVAKRTENGSTMLLATRTEIHAEDDMTCELIDLGESWFDELVNAPCLSLPHEMQSARDMLLHVVDDWNEIPDAGKANALGHIIDDLEVARREVAE